MRVSADSLDRLLSLTGESLVESRRLKSFSASMLRMKRVQREAVWDYPLNLEQPLALWVADPQRYLPEERQSFLDECRKQLEKYKRPYVLIGGASFDERTKNAIAACQKILL